MWVGSASGYIFTAPSKTLQLHLKREILGVEYNGMDGNNPSLETNNHLH